MKCNKDGGGEYMKSEIPISTGFDKLDQKIGGGLFPGELIVVAGRPLVGKTTFVFSMAQRMRNKRKLNIAFFSLQTEFEQLFEKTGRTNHNESDVTPQKKNSIIVDDTAGISVVQLGRKCIECKREHDIDIVFIDYFQLMSGDDSCESRILELDFIAFRMKQLAVALNIPIVLVVQQGRAIEQNGELQPMISELRESGSIAQMADTIMMLYREEADWQNCEKKEGIKIYIEKQSHGETGVVEEDLNE